jgi:hypothetical protein
VDPAADVVVQDVAPTSNQVRTPERTDLKGFSRSGTPLFFLKTPMASIELLNMGRRVDPLLVADAVCATRYHGTAGFAHLSRNHVFR